MAIESENSAAARGVGIQIGSGEVNGNVQPFNFSQELTQILPKSGSTTLRIPLVARYIRTEKEAQPGLANGRAIFTLSYY